MPYASMGELTRACGAGTPKTAKTVLRSHTDLSPQSQAQEQTSWSMPQNLTKRDELQFREFEMCAFCFLFFLLDVDLPGSGLARLSDIQGENVLKMIAECIFSTQQPTHRHNLTPGTHLRRFYLLPGWLWFHKCGWYMCKVLFLDREKLALLFSPWTDLQRVVESLRFRIFLWLQPTKRVLHSRDGGWQSGKET